MLPIHVFILKKLFREKVNKCYLEYHFFQEPSSSLDIHYKAMKMSWKYFLIYF